MLRRTIVATLVSGLVGITAAADSTPPKYFFSHLAGPLGGWGNADGPASAARFTNPTGVAVDPMGNLFVVDSANHAVRKISPSGICSTFAGGSGTSGSADGTGPRAMFFFPLGAAADSLGNLYVADTANATIRKITPDGTVSTLAGNPETPGDFDATGGNARFGRPAHVAVDSANNVYVVDMQYQKIRKITPGGVASTVLQASDAYATSSTEQINFLPAGVAVDASGNLYITDTGNATLLKVTPTGTVTILAGTPGVPGSSDGRGSAARFRDPIDVVLDSAGNLYVADAQTYTIRKITPAGDVTTLAGKPDEPGEGDGVGAAARFREATSLTVDRDGNVYVADTPNQSIRKISPAGVVTTFAGAPGRPGTADGSGTAAQFANPTGVAIDRAHILYVADRFNHTIRKVTRSGTVTTVAGLAGTPGDSDGAGAIARFRYPVGVAVDADGNIFVTDQGNHVVRKITGAGVVTTLAGLAGQFGFADGAGANARFNQPSGIAVDPKGMIYVADTDGQTIRQITPAGVVTTLAGAGGQPGSTDGVGTAARFNAPYGLTIDPAGNLFCTDNSSNVVRKITPEGVVTTVAGGVNQPGNVDGPAAVARFAAPYGIAADAKGNLFLGDVSSTIRMITPDGNVSTIGGASGVYGSADGIGSSANFLFAVGIAVDETGTLYVADYSNHAIRLGRPASAPVITSQPASQSIGTGGSVQFSVTAAALPEPRYQWYFNGSPFAGATSSTLSFASARIADAGDYTVTITNDLGSITSNQATLTVSAPPPSAPSPSGQSGAGGGGGGAFSPWFLAALAAVTLLRWRTRR